MVDKPSSGELFGIPYNFQKPSLGRMMSSYWQPDEGMLVEKPFGIGYTLNLANWRSWVVLAVAGALFYQQQQSADEFDEEADDEPVEVVVLLAGLLLVEERARDDQYDPRPPVREVERVADAERLLDEHPLVRSPVRGHHPSQRRLLEVVRDTEQFAGLRLVGHTRPYGTPGLIGTALVSLVPAAPLYLPQLLDDPVVANGPVGVLERLE